MNVAFRFLAWCRKRGLVHDDLPDQDQGNDQEATSPIDACQRVALQPGTLGTPSKRPRRAGDPADRSARGGGTSHPDKGRVRSTLPSRRGRMGRVRALGRPRRRHDSRRRPRGTRELLRYLARAPVSLERMSLMPDGRIAYELRHAWRAGRTHVLLEPMQLMARFAALVPPPRHPLLRSHGAFAPNSSWRKHVMPLTPPRLAGEKDARKPAHPARTSTSTSTSTRRARQGQEEAAEQEPTRPAGTPPAAARANPDADPETASERTPRRARNGTSTGRRCSAACTTWMRSRVPAVASSKFVELVDNERDARSFLAAHGAALGIASDRAARRRPDPARSAPRRRRSRPRRRARLRHSRPIPRLLHARPTARLQRPRLRLRRARARSRRDRTKPRACINRQCCRPAGRRCRGARARDRPALD